MKHSPDIDPTKPITKKQLRKHFDNVSSKALLKWLLMIKNELNMSEEEIKHTKKFPPKAAQIIITHLG